jgi:hypothetical protein
MIIKRIFNNKRKESPEKMETLSSSKMARKKKKPKNQNLKMKKVVEGIGKVAGMRFAKMLRNMSVIACILFSS